MSSAALPTARAARADSLIWWPANTPRITASWLKNAILTPESTRLAPPTNAPANTSPSTDTSEVSGLGYSCLKPEADSILVRPLFVCLLRPGYYGACNEEAMKISLVKSGPLSVSFEVYPDFMHYSGGVYQHSKLLDKFNPFEVRRGLKCGSIEISFLFH